jgi:hypothetical protein
MAQPVWLTPAGSLGTIPEGQFFQLALLAEDPDNNPLSYEVIAGKLPTGIQCESTGLIVGIPKAVVSVQGVPAQVSRDVTSKFAARVYTTRVVNGVTIVDRLADRTFTITVTGQDAPEFTTPAGQIAQYIDGALVSGLQIGYTDVDPDEIVAVNLVAGALPPGLTISTKGLISGFISPLAPIDATAGFSRDGQGFAEYPFDFSTMSSDANYEFVLEVTDGKSSNLRTFSIYVWSQNSLSADNNVLTADNTFITADATPVRSPIVTNPQGSIGTVRSDNFFAYRFNGLDLDGDQFYFEIVYDIGDSSGIPGLTLDANTGWLFGYIPDLGLTELSYNFIVRILKVIDPEYHNDYEYSLSITGALNSSIVWLVDSNLGTINNGDTSIFYVAATNPSDIPLQYRLVSGSDSNLPQGLQLLPSGLIAGRVSFNTFALDLGSTTFDVTFNDLGMTNVNTETTFDMKHSFEVNAYSVNGLVSVNKIFSITVVREYNEPYENLYIQAMPPQQDRDFLNSLLQNQDIFQTNLLYRNDDPNFGKANKVVYNHAFGLTASTQADYVASLNINHYWKNLVLGEIKVAQARRNGSGELLYEVVYSQIIDDLVNAQGESVSKEVTLPYPINAGDSTEVDTVYPNSLIDMRDQVIDQIGQISKVLPLWMLSKQSNGRVLGFTPAWTLAYAKPGQGERLAYYIRTKFGERLNLIDFEVDRYEIDRLLTHNWDPVADSSQGAWEPPGAETTFDINAHYQSPEADDSTIIFSGGTGYSVGDKIRISGSQVGGQNVLNDILITVNTVNEFGTIYSAFYQGTAPNLDVGDSYSNIAGTNVIGSGTGATWDFIVTGFDQTIFDGDSLKFIAPVDMYSNTTVYDKYLVFPRRNILE